MKVIVTGGAGFLGSHVLQELTMENVKQYCFDDLSVGNRSLVPDTTTFINGKIDHYDTVMSTVRTVDPDVVIHLAAVHHIPTCEENIVHACQVNVFGTQNILQCLDQIGFSGTFIFASTGGVYSPFDNNKLDEKSEVFPVGVYSTTKAWCEKILQHESLKGKYKVINLRLFNMVGENETNPHIIPDILIQLAEDNKTVTHGNLHSKRDIIHVKDVAKLIKIIANENFASASNFETYNVCTGKEYSVCELIDMCKTTTNKTFTMTKDQKRTRKSDRISQLGSNTKAQLRFSWVPVREIQSGIADLWHQIQSGNYYFGKRT